MTVLDVTNGLAPYVPRLALEWLTESPSAVHKRIEGTLAFVDVSGFTALTERLAGRGKVGAEEITDVIGGVFGELLGIATTFGADLLKWGGDATLLFFSEPDSARRACRAAMLMSDTMRRAGRIRTSAGRVTLGVSIGAHTGGFDLYLLGDRHRELVVTGPAATVTARMETIAEAGEVVVSPATADRLGPGVVGVSKEEGLLIAEAPDAAVVPRHGWPDLGAVDVASLLPADSSAHLLSGVEQAQHRQAGIAFLQFTGVDQLTELQGPEAVVAELLPIINRAEEAAERNGVNFHETDIAADGGKIVLLGGVPVVRGNDTERVIRAARAVVAGHDPNSPLKMRAGVNAGRVFIFPHEFNTERRIWSTTGDAVNLAARVMGRAEPGQVVVTDLTLAKTRNPFETESLPPFRVKGKSEPVIASIVGRVRESGSEALVEQLPFTGRDKEMASILERAREAEDGRGSVVEIVGSAGIGKSRLVSEAIDRWGLSTVRVACEEYGGATPYLPVRRVLRVFLGLREDSPHEVVAAELDRAVAERAPQSLPFLPLLGAVLDVPVPSTRETDELEDRFRRARLEQTVLDLLLTYLTVPSALVFEDAHAMDEASASLLQRISDEASHLPLLIVLTRSAEGPARLTGSSTTHLLMQLESLDEGAASQLVEGGSGGVIAPSRLNAIVERANGNPLFLQELLRNAQRSDGADELPESLEPLLVAEIDQLAAGDREVLSAAAVLGSHFHPSHLSDLLGGRSPDAGTWSRLGAFLAPTARGWRFAHGLMREAAYEGLSFRRRRDLHALAAESIEARTTAPEEEAELLSLHWLKAERFPLAWRYSRLAGDRARSIWANADAAIFYERALEAAKFLPLSPSEVSAVAEALGDAWELSANFERSRRAYVRARRLSADEVDRARMLRKVGVLHERQGHYRPALACYTRGRRLLSSRADRKASAERSEQNLASAGIKSRQGQYRACIRFAADAAREAELARHRSGLAHALFLQHMMAVYLGDYSDKLALESLAIYEVLDDLVGQANVLNNLGIAAYYQGEWDEAMRYYERSREARVRSGDVIGAATEENNIAEILSDQGRFEEARPLFKSARATWSSSGYRIGSALATSNLGRLEARAGSLDPALSLLQQALADFQEIRSPVYVVETRLRLGEREVLAGEFHNARSSLQDLLDEIRGRPEFEQYELPALRLLGTALVVSGVDSNRREDIESGGRLIDEAIERSAKAHALYELGLALSVRAALRQLAIGSVGLDPWEGDDDALLDHARAQEVLRRLGVARAPITWAPAVNGSSLIMATGAV